MEEEFSHLNKIKTGIVMVEKLEAYFKIVWANDYTYHMFNYFVGDLYRIKDKYEYRIKDLMNNFDECSIELTHYKDNIYVGTINKIESTHINVLNHSNDMVFLVSAEGRIIDANQKAVQTYGYTYREILDMTVMDFRKSDDSISIKNQLSKGLKGAIKYKAIHYKRDGSIFPVEIRLFRASEYREDLLLSIVSDESDEIEKLDNMKLQNTVLKDKLKAIESDFYRLNARANKYNQLNNSDGNDLLISSENDYFGYEDVLRINRDIKKSLQSVYSDLECIGDPKTHLMNRFALIKAREKILRLINIIESSIELTKLNYNNHSEQDVYFNISQIVQMVIDDFRDTTIYKNVEFVSSIGANMPLELIGPKIKTRFILKNLIHQALAIGDVAQVRLIIHKVDERGDKIKCQFKVEKQSLDHKLDRVREIADKSMEILLLQHFSNNVFGSLGPSTSREGGIDESQSLCFTMEFRVQGYKNAKKVQYIEEELSLDIEDKNILLVEDNLINQQLGKAYLENMGMHVEVASDGHEAITKTLSTQFELILLDIQLPDLTGFEVMEIIRQNEESTEILMPIVGMVGFTEDKMKELCLKKGMNDCLLKPFNEEELHKIVAKFVNL